MQTNAFARTIVALSVATAIVACGDSAPDIGSLIDEQVKVKSDTTVFVGSGGTAPQIPTVDTSSVTDSLTIAYNDSDYPFSADGENKFYYGLDEHAVVIPETGIMLDFTTPADGNSTTYPIEVVLKALDDANDAATAPTEVVLVMPEGHFVLDQTFNIDLADYENLSAVTIMGHGINKTTLDYKGASVAKDGFLISNGANLELSHFSVLDSNNNAIKVTKTDGVYMHHLGTIWPGTPDIDNGAYGLYPVETKNVIVENSFSYGSADAGVYVGQSENIVVRHNFAVANVAGIEIENSKDADVYSNYAFMNTAGILIFDLPIGNNHYGDGTRIFNNVSVANNTDNFANVSSNPAGVHIAPPGSGMIVLASRNVEIFDNDIAGNDSYAIAISSYFLAEQDFTKYADPNQLGGVIANGWKPVPRGINIHDNRIAETGANPRGALLEDPALPIIDGFVGINGLIPAIFYDGLGQNLAENSILQGMGELPFRANEQICATNNGGATVGELFDHTTASNAFAIMQGSGFPAFALDLTGESLLNCELNELPVYTVNFNGVEMGCGADDMGEVCTAATPAPTRLDELTIEVPDNAYPMNADSDTAFYYGLDEMAVTIPDGAIMLDFTTPSDGNSATYPIEALLEALDVADTNATTATHAVLVMPEGRFVLDQTFNIDLAEYDNLSGVTIMGHGIDKTILDYKGASVAKDGFLISNGTNLELAHFSVLDSNNNAIKVTKTDGIYMHHLGTIWPGVPDKDNGAYGLYPVETSNVLIEDSFSYGSADAGVYVGQSTDIVVRRNFAIANVAGIEIENSKNADVYDNYAHMNTAGILIFDLPIGNGNYGSGVRIFNNTSIANNTDNFASGSSNPAGVHIAPPGSGMIVLSTNSVEIFDNSIVGNESYAIAVSSYFLAEPDFAKYSDPAGLGGVLYDGWRPVPRAINMHDNEMVMNATRPRGALINDVVTGFYGYNGRYPEILYDGLGENLANIGAIEDMGEAAFSADDAICAMNNGYMKDGIMVNILAGTVFDFTGMIPAETGTEYTFTMSESLLDCSHDALPVYDVEFNGMTYGCGIDDTTSDACKSGD